MQLFFSIIIFFLVFINFFPFASRSLLRHVPRFCKLWTCMSTYAQTNTWATQTDSVYNDLCSTFSKAGCPCSGETIEISELGVCGWTAGPLSGAQQTKLQYHESTGGFVLSGWLCSLADTDKQIHWHLWPNSLFIHRPHYDLLISRRLKDPSRCCLHLNPQQKQMDI